MKSGTALLLVLALAAASRAAEPVAAPHDLSFAVDPPAAIAGVVMPPSDLGLSDARWGFNYARGADGAPLEALGRGQYGAAYIHPEDRALMVKISAEGFGRPTLDRAMDRDYDMLSEAEATRRIADAGAGPRLIGVTRVAHRMQPLVDKISGWFGVRPPDWSRPAVVKERVIGRTIGALKRERRFTAEHEAMVREMKARLNGAGLSSSDLHGENIMIGATASDAAPKAHLIDAGFVRSL